MSSLPSFSRVQSVLLLISTGIAGPLLAQEQAMVRDSAGIQIVENLPLSNRARFRWKVGEEPLVVIGSASGAAGQDLYLTMEARRLSDERIVLTNFSSEIRFYAADGRYLKTVGGAGDGPGEFRRLAWVSVGKGDSIFAYDTQPYRLSVFDASGIFARSVMLDPGTASLLLLADGSMVGFRETGQSPMTRTNQIWQTKLAVVRHAADGAVLNRVTEVSHLKMFGNSGFFVAVPFSPRASLATDGLQLYAGSGETYQVSVYRPDGTLLCLVRNLTPASPVTQEDIARWEADRRARLPNLPRRRTEPGGRAPIPDPPYPFTLPAFSDLMVDKVGNLWVGRYQLPGDEINTWDIYNSNGHLVGWAETPARLRVTEIGRDYIMGVWKDEIDLEYVRLYSLQPVNGG